ncbi:hypothetical protein, partial [Xanthomonas fragariae]
GMLDHLMRTHTETATPQKKAELDDYAHSVMAYNAARSSAAIAMHNATRNYRPRRLRPMTTTPGCVLVRSHLSSTVFIRRSANGKMRAAAFDQPRCEGGQ